MTVEAIRLKNFMPFVDTGWIEFRPITLLFGRNSSGKSAFIRALRLLKQSVDSEKLLQFTAVAEGDVDLDSYERTVHGNVTKRQIGFAFRCQVPAIVDQLREQLNVLREDKISAEDASTLMELHLAYGWSESNQQVEIREVEVLWPSTGQADTVLFTATKFSEEHTEAFEYEWQIVSDYDEVVEMNWSLASIETDRGFLPQLCHFDEYNTELTHTVADVLADLGKVIEEHLHDFAYVGPLRPAPQRVYLLNETKRQSWRRRGWEAFIDLLDNKVSAQGIEQLNYWIHYLDLGNRIKEPVQDYADKDVSVSRLKVSMSQTETEPRATNWVDLGSGFPQVFQVMISVMFSDKSLTIIEQPELHIHPSAAANLADFFISRVYDQWPKEQNPQQSGYRFIIETHSEAFLLRLRRRIAETYAKLEPIYKLSLADLSVIFVDRSDTFSQVGHLVISQEGEIVDTSKEMHDFRGFFTNDLEEIASIVRAKRVSRQS